jgi:hypothetical protein
LGLISPKDFYDQMVSRIGIDEDKALEVASEVNEKVFLRIRDFMKDYYAEEDKKDTQIVPSEKRILNSVGIKIGDEVNEPDRPEAVEMAPVIEDDDEELIEPPIEETKIPTEPDIKEKLKDLPILKNPPKNYFDPYREPIE